MIFSFFVYYELSKRRPQKQRRIVNKEAVWKEFGGLLDFFVWNVAEAIKAVIIKVILVYYRNNLFNSKNQ
jgi:hypothetical protein